MFLFFLVFNHFPFQECQIEMVLDSTDENSVVLVAQELWMIQAADMNLFVITEHCLVNMTHPKKGVKMEMKLKRKIMSEMMTTYLPSFLLMMITFATTFFKPFFFEAALSVNLTTMLVMTTIFISKMEGLPPTSDIKMIDIWLVLCQMVPFAEVVLLTAIEYNREDKKKVKRTKKKGKKKSRNTKTTSLVVAHMDENHRDELDRNLSVVGGSEDVGPEGKWCQRCWIPHLKTIGT